jgi:hypothetical protein
METFSASAETVARHEASIAASGRRPSRLASARSMALPFQKEFLFVREVPVVPRSIHSGLATAWMPVVKPGVPRRGLLVDQSAWTPRCALKVPAHSLDEKLWACRESSWSAILRSF